MIMIVGLELLTRKVAQVLARLEPHIIHSFCDLSTIPYIELN